MIKNCGHKLVSYGHMIYFYLQLEANKGLLDYLSSSGFDGDWNGDMRYSALQLAIVYSHPALCLTAICLILFSSCFMSVTQGGRIY